jgi:hypothetical protein
MRRMMTTMATSVSTATANSAGVQSLARFATVERALAVLCITIPLWLVLFDEEQDAIRGSVSSYYDMTPPQAYYFPLTVAAMLFMFNGIVKTRRFYNVVLGVCLSGVVLFNMDGATAVPHYMFAVGFFGLNAIVILWFSNDVSVTLRNVLIVVLLAALLAWIFIDAFTTFWAETVSLIAIAAHFVLDSIGFRGYSTTAGRSPVS